MHPKLNFAAKVESLGLTRARLVATEATQHCAALSSGGRSAPSRKAAIQMIDGRHIVGLPTQDAPTWREDRLDAAPMAEAVALAPKAFKVIATTHDRRHSISVRVITQTPVSAIL